MEKTLDILRYQTICWPEVDLPNSYGSDSPVGEKAYRFLTELVWSLHEFIEQKAVDAIEEFLNLPRFLPFLNILLSAKSTISNSLQLQNFEPPNLGSLNRALEAKGFTSVEELKMITVEVLEDYQHQLSGGSTPTHVFFDGQDAGRAKHKTEDAISEVIAEHLRVSLSPLGVSVKLEGMMSERNRCDITLTYTDGSISMLLLIEAKGQWHTKLFEAAKTQLVDKYTSHPDADSQGIYLVYWVGPETKIGGKSTRTEKSAADLKAALEKIHAEEIGSMIETVVLDLVPAY